MSIDKEKFIDYYVAQVRRGNVSLFLRAGVSASAGLPSWATLLDPCAKQLGIEINGGMDLFLIAQYYANEYGESALKRIVNESINCLSDESTLINRLLDLNFKSIWTTNYDYHTKRRFHIFSDDRGWTSQLSFGRVLKSTRKPSLTSLW